MRFEQNIVKVISLSDENSNDFISSSSSHSPYLEVNETGKDYDMSPDLTSKQAKQLKQFLTQNQDVFSQGPHDLGRTSIAQHEITTNGSPPPEAIPHCTTTKGVDYPTYHIYVGG